VKPTKEIRKALQDASFRPEKIVAASVGKDYGTDTTIKKDDALKNAVRTLNEKFGLATAKVQVFKAKAGHVADFVDSCYTREATVSPAEVGGRTSILCGLCNMSYVYDTGFDWDPVKNDFANGTGKGISLKRDFCRNGWNIKV